MTTPIRRQYLDIKGRYPQAIVFFRLGDFYETFDDDAVLVSRELEITLTSKPMGKDLRVPLAGVPHHSLQAHLKRLVARGYKVAICEQMEDPRKAKGLVERDVVRVITPGTLVEEDLLSAAANNYLVAVQPGPGEHGVAFVDVSTGEFSAAIVADDDLPNEIARLAPAEVLIPEGSDLPTPFGGSISPLDARAFHSDSADERLRTHFSVHSMEAFGMRPGSLAACAAGAILYYLRDNQRPALANIKDLRLYNPSRFMVLDATARRHLELYTPLRDGSRQSSLIETIDSTRSPMGARLLRRWLGQPLLDVKEIETRQDAVEVFLTDGIARSRTRDCFRDVADIERIISRITLATASPRDLAGLRKTLAIMPDLMDCRPKGSSQAILSPSAQNGSDECLALLQAALADEPAPSVGEGGVIRSGFSPQLDEDRLLTTDTRQALAALETEERERTGIRSLRVAYNRVFGYYIEVSNANVAMVPPDFQRRQTLAGAERFVTPRLKELEERILLARESISELEGALFRQVCQQIAGLAGPLRLVAGMLAETDVYSALAETAARFGYVRPVMDEGSCIEITDGRHPVVERFLGEGRFVPNDTQLDSDDAQIVVLTGPNMAGKSTFLRQVALITLLAQAGSFVPATSARIGIVDRIFTRIGAQDDLSRGESTFMVEMIETAAILRNATRRSLILFDEVGRGTSTYDGLAIARAVVEYLHLHSERAAKTLFATHYHEMTQLATVLPRVRNYSVAVTEQDDTVVFLHRIVAGGADRSYGIHVAELAGMPAPVIQRAREVLTGLESTHPARASRAAKPPVPQLSLLPREKSEIEAELASIQLDGITPLQALTRLYELQSKARQRLNAGGDAD